MVIVCLCWLLLAYQNVHLSWNPDLFAYRTSTHNFWPKEQGPSDDTFNCGENPQYIMTLSQSALTKRASIWILVSRHVTKQEQEGCEVKDYLTVHLHRNDRTKDRIWYPRTKRNVLTGAYTNNPHCLVRYDVTDPSDEYLSIVLSQYEKSHDLGYTLSCFCTEPFQLGPPTKELPFARTITSSWTESTAGGPVGKKRFYRYVLILFKFQTIVNPANQLSSVCSAAILCMPLRFLKEVPFSKSSAWLRRHWQLMSCLFL